MQRRPPPHQRVQLGRQRRLGGLHVELNGDHEIALPIAACPAEGPRDYREIFG